MSVKAQNISVALTRIEQQAGGDIPLTMSTEWYRYMTDLAKAVNELQVANQALLARLTAAGIP